MLPRERDGWRRMPRKRRLSSPRRPPRGRTPAGWPIRAVGRRREGVHEPGLLRLLLAIDDLQAELGVSGALAEVGVYRQSFAPWPGSIVRVDAGGGGLLHAQEHNVDESGVGSRDRAFLRNLRRLCARRRTTEGNEEEREMVGSRRRQ